LAALPRFSPRIEHRLVRFLCELPASLQRLLAGGSTQIDGLTLAPDIEMLLLLARLSGDESVTGESPTPEKARVKARIEAATVSGPRLPLPRVERIEIPGPSGTIPAHHYLPPQAGPNPRPLLVFFHGGGWVIGDLDTHDGVCRFLAHNTGASVLSVEYRLAPEHTFPSANEDAFACFLWATERAAELGADPKRIAVIGDSAGGHLAAGVSLLARDEDGPRPAMQALLYPVTDAVGDQRSRELFAKGFLLTKADMEWFEQQYVPEPWMMDDPRVSILRAEDLSGLAPAYVTTAGFDPLRDEAEIYAERMHAAGVQVALRRHPGLIHGFANLTAISRTSRAAMHELAGALRMGLS
jgi:acetyl esterase